jgi:hypothetical protein
VTLYRAALERHERLAPYIWDQVRRAVEHGDPIMRPLMFDFPADEEAYTISDEWMLGPAVLAAPALAPGDIRDVHLPPGRWYDVSHGTVIEGPRRLEGYGAPLGLTPAFVRLGAPGSGDAIRVLRTANAPPASLWIDPASADGSSAEVAVHVANWDLRSLHDVEVALSIPGGWSAEPLSPTRFERLDSVRAAEARWRVTAPRGARWTVHPITAVATYRGGEVRAQGSVTLAPEPGGIDPPFRTLDGTGDAQFAQNGDQLAIWAGGRDWSGGYDEKAAIYREAVLPETGSISARVVSHEGGGPAGKAGIVVADDLTDPAAGGYAMLVMSRDYGAELMWDGDGDGRLDGWKGGGASYRPVWLRLDRAGDTLTAFTSRDGQRWDEVGVADVATADGLQDAGVALSAVNLFYPGTRATAVFDSLALPPPATRRGG